MFSKFLAILHRGSERKADKAEDIRPRNSDIDDTANREPNGMVRTAQSNTRVVNSACRTALVPYRPLSSLEVIAAKDHFEYTTRFHSETVVKAISSRFESVPGSCPSYQFGINPVSKQRRKLVPENELGPDENPPKCLCGKPHTEYGQYLCSAWTMKNRAFYNEFQERGAGPEPRETAFKRVVKALRRQ